MGGRHRGEGENLAHCLVSGGGGWTQGFRQSAQGGEVQPPLNVEASVTSAEVTGHSACSSVVYVVLMFIIVCSIESETRDLRTRPCTHCFSKRKMMSLLRLRNHRSAVRRECMRCRPILLIASATAIPFCVVWTPLPVTVLRWVKQKTSFNSDKICAQCSG